MPVRGTTTHDLEKDPLTAQPDVLYGADDLTHLEGLDAVRKRPGMYIGSTDSRGINHLVNEILDNSTDEGVAGTPPGWRSPCTPTGRCRSTTTAAAYPPTST